MKVKKLVFLAFNVITLSLLLNSCASTPHHLKYLPYSTPSKNLNYVSKGSLYVPDSPLVAVKISHRTIWYVQATF